MPVSKRLRYEVLRRDNYTCRYCGASAPDVKLTVDHVVPVALGGSDDPSNLVAACVDCNAGKTSTSPDAPLVADVEQDALRWSRAMAAAAQIERRQQKLAYEIADALRDEWRTLHVGYIWIDNGERGWHKRDNPERKYPVAVVRENDDYSETGLELFDDEYEAQRWLDDYYRRRVPPMDEGWRESVLKWVSHGLDIHDLCRAAEITANRRDIKWESRWRYFCGVAWNILSDRQEVARGLVTKADADGDPL